MSTQRSLLCIYPWLELGGADKFNRDMLACLRERGWRATLVTTLPASNRWRAAFEPLCSEIIDLTSYTPEECPARLLQVAAARSFDVVLVSNSAAGYALLPYLRAHLPQPAFVDYCHMEEPSWNNGGYPRMSLDAGPYLDLRIVSSQHLRRWMLARGGPAERIAVCTTNIDTAAWDPAHYDRTALRGELGVAPGAPVVLYAARLERQKQPLLAAEVMRAVARQVPEAIFLVAGDGRFAGFLRGFVRHHRLGRNVRLLGALSNQRVRELLAASDLFFLPSQMEGISLAIYEAMAMGVATLSAAVGGQAELVTPPCGVLVRRGPDEHAAYAQAMVELLADQPRLRRMGQAARRRVAEHFPIERMGARIDELLSRAIDLHRATPGRPVDAATALAAARQAITVARAGQEHQMLGSRGVLRQAARAAYWRAIDGPGWWLAPLVESRRGAMV